MIQKLLKATNETIVEVMPEASLEVLSQHEVDRLLSVGEGNQHETLRRCALAVLNVGSRTDDTREVLEQYANFDIRIIQQERGIKLAVSNAPADAFVEGEMIRSVLGANAAIPDGAEVVDLSESFVLPGVMDMHTHVVGNLDPYFFAGYFQSPHRATIGGVVNAKTTLMAGFTTIRNVGAGDYADVALRNAINAGEVPGPRMAVSGPGLGITGGHCDRNSLNSSFEERGDGVADGPWAVREQVRKNVK